MKTLLLLLILTIGASVNSAYAQAAPSQTPASTPQADTRLGANEVVDMLAKKLSLSDDQKSKILPIIADRRQKIQEVRDDPYSSSRLQMLKARSIMQESDKRINMILTPEQRQIYAQVEQEMRAQMKARRPQGSVAP